MTESAKTHPIILGTAGHIDHGKTALVRALTGIDTDRLKEEKERGITTELGFAHVDLEGRRFGLVDVPGHERFIKSMAAGAGGVDLVCLVIAADEGIMPQTREHLDICELLGVRRGVVALSKSDLVDEEWLALVEEEVAGGLAGTFLEGADIIPVSAKSGAGLDALRGALVRLTAELPARPAGGIFRLPLDRVFSIRGFGTVVTGTVLGGAVKTGDALVSQPRGVGAKVRGIEVHGETRDDARAGMRCALNLSGVSREQLARGDILTFPGAITPSHIIDARFRYLETSRAPLKRRSKVLLHHATSQRMATLILADRDQLAPGEEALVQLRLDAAEPLAALPGDRFIVRGFVVQEHYGTTLGGGEILRVLAPKVRRSSEEAAETLKRIAEADADERIALEIKGARASGLSLEQLEKHLGIPAAALRERVERLCATGELVRAGAGEREVFCHAEPFARLEKSALAELDRFHQEHPGRDGMAREELRGRLPRSLPPALFEALLDTLVRRGAAWAERDAVGRLDRRRPAAAAGGASELETRIADAFRGWGVTPKRPKEIPAELGAGEREARDAMRRLLDAKRLVRVKSDLYYHGEVIDRLRAALTAHLDEHGTISPLEWKAITGASRKFSIPLAEYFDAEKLTLRVGDVRKRRG